MVEQVNETSYDEVPYLSYPLHITHPGKLAVVAHLLGLQTPREDNCRVLEMACSTGGNLISMAIGLPDSQFVGIDLSPVQVKYGQETIKFLGLENIRLQALNIMDVNEDFGEFDYIIAHGVYSWVPDQVKAKILDICSKNLSPNGLAYVSYNTYPGWRMRGMLRDMMCFHANKFKTPQERVNQARALLNFLSSTVDSERSAYGLFLKTELEELRQSPDYYLLHEHLESINDPIYFYQFVEHLAQHKLQYLGDSELGSTLLETLPGPVRETLQAVTGDFVQTEQYIDFVRNRMFRRSLLTHDKVALNRLIEPMLVKDMYLATDAIPASDRPNIRSSTELETFKRGNFVVSTRNPITKAAMMVLIEQYPETVHFEKLRKLARKKLSTTKKDSKFAEEDGKILASDLLSAYLSGLLELRVCALNVTNKVSVEPKVNELVRYQAREGWVTSQWHRRVDLDQFSRFLLPMLDGTRDRKALNAQMLGLIESGYINPRGQDRRTMDANALNRSVARAVDEALTKLCRAGLLV